MRILLAASEAAPFAKTGGLADVAGSLPKALAALGAEVVLILPLYGSIDREARGLERTRVRIEVGAGTWREEARLWAAELVPGARALFLENDRLFGRPALYGEANGAYPDNARRFAFFAHAVAQVLRAPPDGRPFDILHAHDWQAALAPVFLRTLHAGEPPADRAGTVLTIHNLAYAGVFPPSEFAVTGLPERHFNWKELEFWDQVSFLKGGIVHADVLSTVSERYAREILTPEFGCGLDGVLADRRDDLYGVLNGVDYTEWSPEIDVHIPHRYSATDPAAKASCRRVLLREMGLPDGDDVPLAGCVSRLVDQKGFDLIEARLGEILGRVRMVLLGSGDPGLERRLVDASRARPDRLSVKIGLDESLAHRIEAGADLFLMPSAFEPCGLNQIYSLRYGAVPIVRATGGLDDTVVDADADPARGTGFKFGPYDPDALLDALDRALLARADAPRWNAIRERGMRADFSWSRAADKYLELYRKAVAKRSP